MSRIYAELALSIGHTPLVRLNRITDGARASVLAKLEGRNPTGSAKCRVAAAMLWDADKRGLLGPGRTLVAPSSGNLGIALAFFAAARGIPVTVTLPDNLSTERSQLLRAGGAQVVLTDSALGMQGAIARAEQIAAADPRCVLLQPFSHPANPAIHETTTGPEIHDDTGGRVDIVVAGVGTGGTLSGVSRYLKHTRGLPLLSVAVEPAASPVLTQARAGLQPTPRPHRIQGLGAGFVPAVLDLGLVDAIEVVSDDEAARTARRLAREEGIRAGISGGAAAAAALRWAHRPEHAGQSIVVLLPDAGDRELSTGLFDDPGAAPLQNPAMPHDPARRP